MWPRFLEVFNDEYFLEMVQDQKTIEFLNLKQGKVNVVEYNTKFIKFEKIEFRIFEWEFINPIRKYHKSRK